MALKVGYSLNIRHNYSQTLKSDTCFHFWSTTYTNMLLVVHVHCEL